ncbi:hypothetical protein PR048_025812 [Dryococelus australis]|uniref:Uncharacterized protein n=1 Tax=Dryococelus australis TaxID=614101 RepID=A0ABQ9GJL1_9NEOP|nr:hypothetical protein PR048_025812 [Dryococelus australis]
MERKLECEPERASKESPTASPSLREPTTFLCYDRRLAKVGNYRTFPMPCLLKGVYVTYDKLESWAVMMVVHCGGPVDPFTVRGAQKLSLNVKKFKQWKRTIIEGVARADLAFPVEVSLARGCGGSSPEERGCFPEPSSLPLALGGQSEEGLMLAVGSAWTICPDIHDGSRWISRTLENCRPGDRWPPLRMFSGVKGGVGRQGPWSEGERSPERPNKRLQKPRDGPRLRGLQEFLNYYLEEFSPLPRMGCSLDREQSRKILSATAIKCRRRCNRPSAGKSQRRVSVIQAWPYLTPVRVPSCAVLIAITHAHSNRGELDDEHQRAWTAFRATEERAAKISDQRKGSLRLRVSSSDEYNWQAGLLNYMHYSPPSPHKGEPGSIPEVAGAALGFSQVGIVTDDAAGRRVFSEISRFAHPFHSGAAPYSPQVPLIGSQDLNVKNRPDFFTLSRHKVTGAEGKVEVNYLYPPPQQYQLISMEQRWNERAEETGAPRENTPTIGIVRHDYHMQKSPPRVETRRRTNCGGERRRCRDWGRDERKPGVFRIATVAARVVLAGQIFMPGKFLSALSHARRFI